MQLSGQLLPCIFAKIASGISEDTKQLSMPVMSISTCDTTRPDVQLLAVRAAGFSALGAAGCSFLVAMASFFCGVDAFLERVSSYVAPPQDANVNAIINMNDVFTVAFNFVDEAKVTFFRGNLNFFRRVSIGTCLSIPKTNPFVLCLAF